MYDLTTSHFAESMAALDQALSRFERRNLTPPEAPAVTPFSELGEGAQIDLVADYLVDHPDAVESAAEALANVTGEELMNLAINGTKTEIADWLHGLAIGQFAKRIDRARGL